MRSKPPPWLLVLIVAAAIVYLARVRHEMIDFGVYRTAGARAIEAAPLFRAEDGHYQFKYFPAFALAMAPFALVPEEVAKAAWFALSVFLLALIVRWSVGALPTPRLTPRRLTWLSIALMAKFYAHELNLGQTNIVLGALLVASLVAVLRGRPAAAGALVGLGVFVKPYALILLPWLAVAGGAIATAVCTAVVGAGLLAPAVVYGWQGNLDQIAGWYRTVTATTAPNLLAPENVSFATMWAKWIGVGPAASRLAVLTAAAALAITASLWLRRRDVQAPAYLEFGALMLLVPLISPQGWDYVLLLATPAAVCLADRFGRLSPSWRVFTAVAIALMSFTVYDLLGRALYARLMGLSVVSVAAAMLVITLAHLRWRRLA